MQKFCILFSFCILSVIFSRDKSKFVILRKSFCYFFFFFFRYSRTETEEVVASWSWLLSHHLP